MAWPTPQDYNEAVQNPHQNFRDAELRSGDLEVTPMGLPRVASGAFASVYRMHTPRRDVAVRCFLHNVADQQARYAAISEFVTHDDLECTVDFEYVSEGVRVGAAWFPVLKMEWAGGKPLDEWVRVNLRDGGALKQLSEKFKEMVTHMRQDGIAHGDLQHGNLLIQDDFSIRLVDYDGMFVPALKGLECPELGHRNYQHPARSKTDYGPYLDNFSAWSIYTSLFSLSRDPDLMQAVVGGDESLLFRQFDYKNPTKSRTFAVLEGHKDPEIVDLARKFRAMLALAPNAVPHLDDEVAAPQDLPELEADKRRRKAAQIAASGLPAWMVSDDDDAGAVEDDGRGVDGEVDFRESVGYESRKVVTATAQGPWPTLSRYVQAVSVPAASFLDEELQLCRPVQVDGRVHVHRSSQNAVFRLQRGARSIAVKVFLSPDDARVQRYNDLLRYLRTNRAIDSDLLKYVPRFEFQEQGIRVDDRVYPIVKMEWIHGRTLAEIPPDSGNAALFDASRHQFRMLMQALESSGVIHGELEPWNVIVSPEGMRLIDFDGVRSPQSTAPPAVSFGALRHPREPDTVNVYSDTFPAWVIDTALVVLREQPEVRFIKPTGQFLFAHEDFMFPDNSDIMQTMRDSKNTIVHQRYQLLKCFLRLDPHLLPQLKTDAGIDKAFARNHGLDFPDLTISRVSPDLTFVQPEQQVPQVPREWRPGSSLIPVSEGTKITVHAAGSFMFLSITLFLFFHSGILAATPFFMFYLLWRSFFSSKD